LQEFSVCIADHTLYLLWNNNCQAAGLGVALTIGSGGALGVLGGGLIIAGGSSIGGSIGISKCLMAGGPSGYSGLATIQYTGGKSGQVVAAAAALGAAAVAQQGRTVGNKGLPLKIQYGQWVKQAYPQGGASVSTSECTCSVTYTCRYGVAPVFYNGDFNEVSCSHWCSTIFLTVS
jgi:hypothetical protein